MNIGFSRCLDFEKMDCYRFVSDKGFERYLKVMLQVDKTFYKTDDMATNTTFVCVQQNGQRQLKVFPWNQLLVQKKEREDLVKVLYDLYSKNWHDLCYTDVTVLASAVTDWDEFLHECVGFLSGMETQKFYPVILTIGNPSAPYLRIVSLK